MRNNGGRLVLGPDHRPLPVGAWRRQPELASTLGRLAKEGLEDFYTGSIGRDIVADMARNDGYIMAEDLASVPWPSESATRRGSFASFEVNTLPDPGGGSTLLEMLHLLDGIDREELDPDSPDAAVQFATIIRRARQDRARFPDGFARGEAVDGLPLASKAYATAIRNEVLAVPDEGETSHVCVMDRDGNVVSLTQSLERLFGAAVATRGLGFLYNGYMRTFKVRNRRHPHYLKPGAPARSNACPTILIGSGRERLAIGSTGSERMASGIFQVLARLRSSTPFDAVAAPRLHCTPYDQVFLEASRFSPDSLQALEASGFRLLPYDAWSFKVGGLTLALSNGGVFHGVADPRRDGAAAGPVTDP
jgi:gamma-glutamyltranspeptidase/glutathione hydrolase